MSLTLDGSTVLPNMGGSGSGLLGAGGGLLAGGAAGLVGGLLGGALLGGRNGGWGGNGYGGGAAPTAVATDIVLNPAFQSLQNQIQTVQGQINNNEVNSAITAVDATINNVTRDLNNSIANLSTAVATGNFTTLNSINGLGRDVTAQANQNALQQLNSFNQQTTTILQGFNSNAMQVQNSTNQIIAQGTATAAQMAECCCQIKATIMADGNATRALINQLDKENLQSQLLDSKNQVSNLNQSIALSNSMAAQTNTILHHLMPVTTATAIV